MFEDELWKLSIDLENEILEIVDNNDLTIYSTEYSKEKESSLHKIVSMHNKSVIHVLSWMMKK